MKKERHAKILECIRTQPVETQDQLLSLLRESGFDVTQATVSRDIRELRLFKRADHDGRSRYVTEGDASTGSTAPERYRSILRDSVVRIEPAGNLLVVKCHTGIAQPACVAIDGLHLIGLVGSLAGEDTIFLACRKEEDTARISEEIQTFL